MTETIMALRKYACILVLIHLSCAKLLVNDYLDTLQHVCMEPTSHKNCTKTFMVSTTCPETPIVRDDHLTRKLVRCPPGGRPGTCTQFQVEWCNNSIYPAKGGCYRSEYANTPMMQYGEYWFGFSLYLPKNYSVDVDAVHFQVHGNPNSNIHEQNRNPMFELHTTPMSPSGGPGNWTVQARGDPRRNISKVNRTYEWNNEANLGPFRLGEWENFVYHTKWVYDSPTGFVEIWRNGDKVVDWQDTGTAYNDEIPPYFKFGIYSASWGYRLSPPPSNVSTSIVIYGGVKQGDASSSYAEVDTTPKPEF